MSIQKIWIFFHPYDFILVPTKSCHLFDAEEEEKKRDEALME